MHMIIDGNVPVPGPRFGIILSRNHVVEIGNIPKHGQILAWSQFAEPLRIWVKPQTNQMLVPTVAHLEPNPTNP